MTADSRAPEGGRASDANVFREEARREGFLRSGIARAGEPPGFPRFSAWLASGMHAGMRYLAETRQARADPAQILPGARSIVCLSAEYSAAPHRSADGAVFARYARGADYHGTLRQRAEGVARSAALRIGRPFAYRVCVDTTPLAERSFAAAAGLGWIGKNGCVIDPERGSYLLLAEIVTDLDLPPDDPVAEQCGSCARCLQACPTQAFPSPGIVDASRCLAYWTIEHRGPFPDPVKAAVADRLFGCDICQEVCPWNGGASEPAPAEPPPTRAEWLAMGPGQWRRRFARSAFNRAGRRGMQRNAAASAGSSGDRALLPALRRAAGAQEAGLSDAAAWAAARLDAG